MACRQCIPSGTNRRLKGMSKASIPVAAQTEKGWDKVSSGSSRVTLGKADASPQAIFR